MGSLSIIFWLIVVVVAILQAILFFKLWGACDNIKRIADKYAPDLEKHNSLRSTIETKEDLEKWLKEDK